MNRRSARSALILGGGKSLRMGYDKKKLALSGAPVMENLITALTGIFKEVLVSSNGPFAHPLARVIPDSIGAGPLAGIYQGLACCESACLYVTACDMPFISRPYIEYMREIIRAEDIDACLAARADGFREPFNGFYHKSCREPLYNALSRGEYKISLLLDKLKLHIIPPEVVKQYGADLFFNINTPEDLARALRAPFDDSP
ncbi:MAG: molybdenum cofactor guanylyltransferase [Spirochaetaceae bacterium]|nr:molybdenum cofactor guanylyltransferase [Spirochaetaceae bacterium]